MKRNNLLLSAVLFLAFSFSSNAQIEIGAKAGVNFTNFGYTSDLDFGTLTTDDVVEGAQGLTDASYRTGFHFGAYALLDIGAISLQPEILFSKKGVTDYAVGVEDLVLNYISIPILLGFQPLDILHLQVGPEFSFLTSNKAVEGDNDREIDDFFATSDLGIAIGASIDWPGPGLLSVRYVHGLSGVVEDDVNQGGGDSFNLRNRTFQASLAFPIFNTDGKKGARSAKAE